ncbi:hypothetical protein, partial [Methanocalculus natronophilus]|uniref:hypothetical protein n=1 Tax=Methanocalculus natronophilus TaxID=1262400 RepID=UPI0031B5DF8C
MNYDPLKLDAMYKAIHKNYPNILNWLKSMPLYIETDDYIFTHGGIDITLDDWRKQDRKSFVWNYQSSLKPHPTKTIVVGHERTKMIRLKR